MSRIISATCAAIHKASKGAIPQGSTVIVLDPATVADMSWKLSNVKDGRVEVAKFPDSIRPTAAVNIVAESPWAVECRDHVSVVNRDGSSSPAEWYLAAFDPGDALNVSIRFSRKGQSGRFERIDDPTSGLVNKTEATDAILAGVDPDTLAALVAAIKSGKVGAKATAKRTRKATARK